MKKFFVFFLLLFLSSSAFCTTNAMWWWGGGRAAMDSVEGNGHVVTINKDLSLAPYSLEMRNISFVSSPGVQIRSVPGEYPRISLTTDENIVAITDVRVDERCQTIEILSREKLSPTAFIVEITTPFKGFVGRGKFNFNVTSGRVSAFNLNVDGESKGEFNLNVDGSLSVNANGQSSLRISGYASTFNLSAQGESNVDAVRMHSHTCVVSCNGGGKVCVNADTLLDLRMGGNWECVYDGNPRQLNKSFFGICRLHPVGASDFRF